MYQLLTNTDWQVPDAGNPAPNKVGTNNVHQMQDYRDQLQSGPSLREHSAVASVRPFLEEMDRLAAHRDAIDTSGSEYCLLIERFVRLNQLYDRFINQAAGEIR